MTEVEYNNNTKYFNADTKKLKPAYLLHYHSKPDWSEIPRIIDIFIDKNYSFEIKMFWYKQPLKKRLYSFYQSNLLPTDIKQILDEFLKLEKVNLKKIYISRNEKYSPEGISEDYYEINHSIKSFSINCNSYWTDKELFKTKEEILFLELHNLLEKWKDNLYENVIKLHQ